MTYLRYFLLFALGVACTTQKFKVLKPLSMENGLDQFITGSCLSSEGDIQVSYFNKEQPKVSYEAYLDNNYKNWGLAISIPFSGEEDLHLDWRRTFTVEGSIGSKIRSTRFNRVLRRYEITRSEIMRALSYWADSIDVIARARNPKDKINREKLLNRIELEKDQYIINKEISEKLRFSWSFSKMKSNYFEQQVVELFSPIHKQGIRFSFYVRECLK